MRSLLSFMVFTLALTSVATVGAQDRRWPPRTTTVVVEPGPGTRRVDAVRVAHPRRAVEPWGPRRHREDRALRQARRDLFEARHDYERILRIRRRWHDATAMRDPRARREAELRAIRWVDAELAESYGRRDLEYRVHRLHGLRDELEMPRRWSTWGARHPYGKNRKARVLDDLVRIARRDVERAAHHPYNRYALSR